jgi:hypothetical protein
VDFIEGGMKVIRHEAVQLIHLDMLVFIGAEANGPQASSRLSADFL